MVLICTGCFLCAGFAGLVAHSFGKKSRPAGHSFLFCVYELLFVAGLCSVRSQRTYSLMGKIGAAGSGMIFISPASVP